MNKIVHCIGLSGNINETFKKMSVTYTRDQRTSNKHVGRAYCTEFLKKLQIYSIELVVGSMEGVCFSESTRISIGLISYSLKYSAFNCDESQMLIDVIDFKHLFATSRVDMKCEAQ